MARQGDNRHIVTTVDWDGHQKLRAGRMDLWLPGRYNTERVQLRVETKWLLSQVCPSHPGMYITRGDGVMMGFSGVRAAWARIPLPSGGTAMRPAVQFCCPREHVWEVILPDIEEG